MFWSALIILLAAPVHANPTDPKALGAPSEPERPPSAVTVRFTRLSFVNSIDCFLRFHPRFLENEVSHVLDRTHPESDRTLTEFAEDYRTPVRAVFWLMPTNSEWPSFPVQIDAPMPFDVHEDPSSRRGFRLRARPVVRVPITPAIEATFGVDSAGLGDLRILMYLSEAGPTSTSSFSQLFRMPSPLVPELSIPLRDPAGCIRGFMDAHWYRPGFDPHAAAREILVTPATIYDYWRDLLVGPR